MRFIHTADWHLGRIFHGVHLTEDQAYVLDQFVELVRDTRADLVIIAGDVYDRAVPPPAAVALLDDVLCRLTLDLGVRVVMVAGNHDGPERLAFGARVLESGGLHVAGLFSPGASPVVLGDDSGPVVVHLVPYTEPALARQLLSDESLGDHDAVMRAMMARLGPGPGSDFGPGLFGAATGGRSIVVAHAFVAGGVESESERPLSVGGAAAVDAARFEGHAYVALGHLHRPQRAGGDNIRYSGSLLKYSFEEADQAKSVSVVEMDGNGACRVEAVRLEPRRDVRRLEGRLAEVLASGNGDRSPSAPSPDDYLLVTLLDDGPLLDPMGRLREVYPNVLHIERPALLAAGGGTSGAAARDHRHMTDLELFRSFFTSVTGGGDLTARQEAAFSEVVERLRREEREAGS